jgi:hypothetical protein
LYCWLWGLVPLPLAGFCVVGGFFWAVLSECCLSLFIFVTSDTYIRTFERNFSMKHYLCMSIALFYRLNQEHLLRWHTKHCTKFCTSLDISIYTKLFFFPRENNLRKNTDYLMKSLVVQQSPFSISKYDKNQYNIKKLSKCSLDK